MRKIFVLICFTMFNIVTFAQQQQEVISSAFETGNIEKLSQFFDTNIDLTVLSTEGIFSKAQSKVILQNFFSKNTPGTFTIQHQGGSELSKYVIGKLTTSTNTYRVYFLFKKINDKTFIQKIRIEDDK